jgi:restriction endonuclease Mrr
MSAEFFPNQNRNFRDRTAVKGVSITTSKFTEQAREFAEHLPIELIDRQKLNILLADVHSPEAR